MCVCAIGPNSQLQHSSSSPGRADITAELHALLHGSAVSCCWEMQVAVLLLWALRQKLTPWGGHRGLFRLIRVLLHCNEPPLRPLSCGTRLDNAINQHTASSQRQSRARAEHHCWLNRHLRMPVVWLDGWTLNHCHYLPNINPRVAVSVRCTQMSAWYAPPCWGGGESDRLLSLS